MRGQEGLSNELVACCSDGAIDRPLLRLGTLLIAA
jgi:hypothetical protein